MSLSFTQLDQFSHDFLFLHLFDLWSFRIQYLAILLKVTNHILTLITDEPLHKFACFLAIGCFCAYQCMCGIEQRIFRVLIATSLVDFSLILQLLIERKNCSTVGDGVFLEENGGRESLNREGNVLVIPG